MSWSIILTILKELTDDDAQSAIKKGQIAADKSSVKHAEATDGGVLAAHALLAGKVEGADMKESRCIIFEKIIRSLQPWLSDLLNDATDYAKLSVPRSQFIIEKVKQINNHSPSIELASIFATNVWPSLKSRGWKVSLITEGDLTGKSTYSFKDKEVRYISAHVVIFLHCR
jgi:hypothetical protein